MENRSGAKGLVFGGLMAALTVVLYYFLPLPMFLPVPLVLVYARFGFRASIISGFTAALLTSLMLSLRAGLLGVLPLAVLPALALGWGITQRLTPLLTITAAAAAAFITMLLNIGVGLLILGQNPIDLMMRSWEAGMQVSLEMMEKFTPAGNPQASQRLEEMRSLMEVFPSLMMQLLPMILLAGSMTAAFLAYVACRWILPRFGHPVEPVRPFREWRLPRWLTWPLLAGGALMLASQYGGEIGDWARRLGLNVVTTISYIYVIVGCAVAYHWLSTKFSKGMAIALLVLVLLMSGNWGFIVLLFLGLWDALFDFRKLQSETRGGNQP